MSVWHEVHCDINRDGCYSHGTGHPSGWSVKIARQRAERIGFKRADGDDICPNCRADPQPQPETDQ